MQIRQDTYKKHYLFLVTPTTGRTKKDVMAEKAELPHCPEKINNKN